MTELGKVNAERFLLDLIGLSASTSSTAEFFTVTARQLAEITGAAEAVICEGTKGQWRVVSERRANSPLPVDALSESLDGQQTVAAQPWIVTPLFSAADNRYLLAIRANSSTSPGERWIQSMAQAIGLAAQAVRSRTTADSRSQRWQSMLEMTNRWNQTRETGRLLEEMAETSTELLSAQRATIFLWDKANRQLIGRPALGVESGEIRIPDDTGIVGQVISTGQPRRVDADIDREQAQINRSIDKQLGFETRSLLCVPLQHADGEIIGAFELINKTTGSFTDEDQTALAELAASAAIAINNTQHVQQLVSSRRHMADQAAEQIQLIGESETVVELKNVVRRVARTDLAVLILGENGTGKEVIAQLIHYHSARRDQVLVTVNCAAITETLLESELFGHEKGAFTDAHEARPGKFELADGGTLFLDEIGDMSLSGQAKLLRVLEEKIVVRVGGSKPISTDVRVLAATNQDLSQLVQQKKFREDLFFRLNVVNLRLPPLRDRGDDILLLAEHFLKHFCARARRTPPTLSATTRQTLLNHAWPGNVRELRNMMERIAYLHEGQTVDPADLSFITSARPADSDLLKLDTSLADATGEFQRQFIANRIKKSRGNMTDAAAALGLHRSNLYRKMRQLGMGTDETSSE